MDYDAVIRHFGTQVKIAQALGLTQGSIAYWKKVGIPVQRQMQIERITGGALKAALPRAWRPQKGMMQA